MITSMMTDCKYAYLLQSAVPSRVSVSCSSLQAPAKHDIVIGHVCQFVTRTNMILLLHDINPFAAQPVKALQFVILV